MNEKNLKPWKKGQSGNPGGVSKVRLGYRQAIEKTIGLEDFTTIVKTLIKEAKKGKTWAVREFFDITLGRDFNIGTNSERLSGIDFHMRIINEDGKEIKTGGQGAGQV